LKPVVVADSTPLIGLSRIRRLHILEELFGDEKGFRVALGELIANGFRLGRDEQKKILRLASRHAAGSSNIP